MHRGSPWQVGVGSVARSLCSSFRALCCALVPAANPTGKAAARPLRRQPRNGPVHMPHVRAGLPPIESLCVAARRAPKFSCVSMVRAVRIYVGMPSTYAKYTKVPCGIRCNELCSPFDHAVQPSHGFRTGELWLLLSRVRQAHDR